jgi:Rap1a immunity proteins
LSLSIWGFSASTQRQDFTKVADLYRQCSNWHRENATVAQIDEANQCLAYIEGFVDGKGPTYKYGCFIGFSYEDMIAAYLEYMRKHPDSMQISKRLGLEAALTTKFCFSAKSKVQ